MRALFLALLILGYPAAAATIAGRVVSIHDGDTITVLDAAKVQYKIRLAGIDAPELKQPYGTRSRKNLSDLIYNKQVKVEWSKRDKYKRVIGKILFIPESCISPSCLEPTDANREQIAVGMAWHYKQYASEQSKEDRGSYAIAEESARLAKAGLWGDAKPVPPWEWRKKKY